MTKNQNYLLKMDHSMVVDGILLHEQTDVTSSFDELTGQNRQLINHKLEIGDLYCETMKAVIDGKTESESTNTNLESKEELQIFLSDWKNAWKPMIFTSLNK